MPAVKPPASARPSPRTSETYNADELIDAYLKGVEHGSQGMMAVLVEKLEENVRTAGASAQAIAEAIRSLGTECSEIFLRIEDITHIDALLLVAEEAYLADEFDAAYTVAREHREAVNGPTLDLSVSFAPNADGLNRTSLTADGFFRFRPETETA